MFSHGVAMYGIAAHIKYQELLPFIVRKWGRQEWHGYGLVSSVVLSQHFFDVPALRETALPPFKRQPQPRFSGNTTGTGREYQGAIHNYPPQYINSCPHSVVIPAAVFNDILNIAVSTTPSLLRQTCNVCGLSKLWLFSPWHRGQTGRATGNVG